MKILLANKFFYDHGGPETVLFAQRDLLRAAGHDVIDFSMQDARNYPSDYAMYFAPPMDLQVGEADAGPPPAPHGASSTPSQPPTTCDGSSATTVLISRTCTASTTNSRHRSSAFCARSACPS